MASLTVKLDPITILREARGGKDPDPAQVVVLAELAGVDGIAMQLRRDRKLMRERDMYLLKELVKTRMSIEIPPVDAMIEKVLEVRPHTVTFVADHADPSAPVSGIDFTDAPVDYSDLVSQLTGAGIRVCFFIEPEVHSVKGAAKAGAKGVLINCREYSDARSIEQAQEGLDRIDQAAGSAAKSELTVRAGGGIDYRNVGALVELGFINEFVVGHAVASRALLVGYGAAVTEMLRLIRRT